MFIRSVAPCAARSRRRGVLATAAAVAFAHVAWGATFQTVQSGDYDAPSTWAVTGGSDADSIPDADDDVTILAPHTVTLTGVHEMNEGSVFGALVGQGPVSLIVYGQALEFEPDAEMDWQGDWLGQATVESVSTPSGNLVTLSWASPPLDPLAVPAGAKLMFLDMRPGDDDCSREAWHIYDVVSTDATSITYSLGDVTNDVIGDQVNNVVTQIALTPPAGEHDVTIDATVPAVDAWVGKFLQLPSGRQYLITEADAVANTLTLFQPLHPDDADQMMTPVVIHNGVRPGDAFVLFDPIRIRGAADETELFFKQGGGRATLRYADVSHFKQQTGLYGGVKFRGIDAAQPGQRLEVEYVDFHHCNSFDNVRGAVEFVQCHNFTVRRINMHDPVPNETRRTAGVRFDACTNATMEESRIYRVRASGFDDGPFQADVGIGNTLQRCVIHDVLDEPLGGDAGDGVNFNGSKQGRILDNLVMHTSHNGIVFHHADQFPQVPDGAVDALVRGCVSLRGFNNCIAYSAGNTHPDRDITVVDCIFGYGGDRNTAYGSSVRYCTSRDSQHHGDLGTPHLLGVYFWRNSSEACLPWEPSRATTIEGCVFVDNRYSNIIRLQNAALPELNIIGNTFFGQPTGSQRCVTLSVNPPDGGTISHNIFARNGRGINYEAAGPVTVTNDWNLYHDMRILNVTGALMGPNAVAADPLFADPNAPDLRLLAGSPALAPPGRGARYAGNIVRSWAMKVANVDGEHHRDGAIVNDVDGNGVTDFGNVEIAGAVARFDFGQNLPVVWPNSEFSLHIAHAASGKSIAAVVPVTPFDSQTFDVSEETFGMLYQYIDETGDVTATLTHVGADGNPGTGLAAQVMFTFGPPPYSLGGLPAGPGDFDGDGDVDLSDFSTFSLCFGGPNVPPAATCPPGIDADFDDDGDVDLADFSAFALLFTGPV